MDINKETVEMARFYITDNLNDGVICPCCGQVAKAYRRSITSSMASTLILLEQLGDGFHDMRAICRDRKLFYPTDFSVLKHFGLIVPSHKNIKGKKSSGLWAITDYGKSFVNLGMTVKKYAHIYNSEVKATSGEYVDIIDALGNKFDCGELMGVCDEVQS